MQGPEIVVESIGSQRYLECGAYKGTGIAVLTSGGDAQGMNAAVRAVVRTSLFLGCQVFYVMEGYQGLVDGYIVQATWNSSSNIIHKGGTVLGSARCKEFRTREGRMKAAKNLVLKGINHLVIIGGDGSLTGANLFRKEWSELLQELIAKKEIDSNLKGMEHLSIVGMVGSIDNDFSGTDMTIGADSALHRILEAIDAIACTAYSHQRTFIMEVMGRRCGYLALCAGLFSNATAVFIPEDPAINWEEDICDKIMKEKESGLRLNIIVVAEGAVGADGQPITAEQIKEVVSKRLGLDTRVTVLGHIQRGGTPSAFDRTLGSRMGIESVLALLESKPETEAKVIALHGNKCIRLPLMQCVQVTEAVAKALNDKNYELARTLRGASFVRRFDIYYQNHRLEISNRSSFERRPYNIGVIHIGGTACGMNAAVQVLVRAGIKKGCRIFGIQEGIDGLLVGNVSEIGWSDVNSWVGEGGALLGARRTLPRGKYAAIAEQLGNFKLHGLFIIGGFEAFQCAVDLKNQRNNYKEFCIPIIVAPATISNNVPGSDLCLGTDTALNEIVTICDRMRQSAQGYKRRVFICETMGGYSGYLATVAAIAGGADAAYIHEEIFSIKDIQRDLYNTASKMVAGVQRGIILRNEKCNENYNCDFMRRLYSEEGKGIFSTRSNIIGHMQQGRTASPFDRNLGITFGLRGVDWLIDQMESCTEEGRTMTTSEDSVVMVGLVDRGIKFTPVSELVEGCDFAKRLPPKPWWLKLRPILRILAKHDSTYEEGMYIYYDEPAVNAVFKNY